MREIENGLTNRGMMRTVARLQAQGGLNQKRLSWLDDSLQTAETGDVVYFVGCVPFADVLLADRIDNGILSVPRAAIRLLNLVGTRPVVLPNEVCCGLDAYLGGDMDTARSLARLGLDAYLGGDMDTARSLARLNVEMFRAVGAKRILTSCAGGAWMLRHYSALGHDHGCEVLHVAEFLAQRLDGIRLPAGTALWPSSVSVRDVTGLRSALIFRGSARLQGRAWLSSRRVMRPGRAARPMAGLRGMQTQGSELTT